MIKKMIYEYNAEKIFLKETTEKYNQFDGSLILPQFYTEVKPIFDSSTDFAVFDIDKGDWQYFPMWTVGVYYDKRNGDAISVIKSYDTRDRLQYTQIEPPQYNEGDLIVFNDEINDWEYTEKGEILLEKERLEALEIAKKESLTQLQNDYNASKVIVIQNGNTITIKHDTEERKFFLDNIELVKNETTNSNTVLSYRQVDKENKCRYSISLVYYIWKYLFIDLFLVARSSGFRESIRSKNEGEYTLAKLKIENARTIDELNAVVCDFVNPQGVVIDVSVKAKEIFEHPDTPENVKQLILKLTNENGEIHLIEKVLCQ